MRYTCKSIGTTVNFFNILGWDSTHWTAFCRLCNELPTCRVKSTFSILDHHVRRITMTTRVSSRHAKTNGQSVYLNVFVRKQERDVFGFCWNGTNHVFEISTMSARGCASFDFFCFDSNFDYLQNSLSEGFLTLKMKIKFNNRINHQNSRPTHMDRKLVF